MRNIIRNCSHFSQIYIAKEFTSAGQACYIVKTSFCKDGASDIKNEALGLQWYANKLGISPESVTDILSYGEHYAVLKIKHQQGKPANLIASIEQNQQNLEAALQHYLDYIGNSGYSHGDYSIDNILYDKGQVVWVTDWEHFNDKLPQWFDPLYCILEACFFWHRQNGRLSRNDIQITKKFISTIRRCYNLPDCAVSNPALQLRKCLHEFAPVFGRQVDKFPFVNCDATVIEQLDNYFHG